MSLLFWAFCYPLLASYYKYHTYAILAELALYCRFGPSYRTYNRKLRVGNILRPFGHPNITFKNYIPRFCRNRKKNNSRNTQSIFIPPNPAPSKSLDLPPVLPSWVVVNENCRITVIVSRGTKGYKVSSLAQLKIHIFTSLL